MIYLPPLRRLLLPSLICLAFVLAYRSSHRINKSYLSSLLRERPSIYYPKERVLVADLNSRYLLVQSAEDGPVTPPQHLYYDFVHDAPDDQSFQSDNETDTGPTYVEPSENRYLKPLFTCKITPNRFTEHIRVPSYIRPISMVVTGETENEKRLFLNAAPMSLPYWSENQYLLVTRVQTDGTAQLNLVCEANICYTDERNKRPKEKPCTAEDLALLGGSPGMRCATPPLTINVPPTPAKVCGNETGAFMDIPGFHDPRIFWSGKGEPLMMMNSQSQYACFGLWVIDLRQVHAPLNKLLGANPNLPTLGPLMSYPHMTELTRNPPETRGPIEKNWMFFSTQHSSYVHYDMGPTVRTFAQLLGGGLTTYNLTDPYERPCVKDGAKPKDYEVWGGSWHQGTNSLRLILCERNDYSCKERPENTVFWSLIHHKHKNFYSLPLRYERYFIVWASTPPFQMLAMSSHPILLANETASGWELEETWDDEPEHQKMVKEGGEGKGQFAVFTYTPSIAYAWGRPDDKPHDKNVGYLDDEVILGIGIDDEAQGYARAKVSDLLQCMRSCPGRAREKLNKNDDGRKTKMSSFFDADQRDREMVLKGMAEGKTMQEIVADGRDENDLSVDEDDTELVEDAEGDTMHIAKTEIAGTPGDADDDKKEKSDSHQLLQAKGPKEELGKSPADQGVKSETHDAQLKEKQKPEDPKKLDDAQKKRNDEQKKKKEDEEKRRKEENEKKKTKEEQAKKEDEQKKNKEIKELTEKERKQAEEARRDKERKDKEQQQKEEEMEKAEEQRQEEARKKAAEQQREKELREKT